MTIGGCVGRMRGGFPLGEKGIGIGCMFRPVVYEELKGMSRIDILERRVIRGGSSRSDLLRRSINVLISYSPCFLGYSLHGFRLVVRGPK